MNKLPISLIAACVLGSVFWKADARVFTSADLALGAAGGGKVVLEVNKPILFPSSLRAADEQIADALQAAGVGPVPRDSESRRTLIFQAGAVVEQETRLDPAVPFCVLAVSPPSAIPELKQGEALEMIAYAGSSQDSEAQGRKAVLKGMSFDQARKIMGLGVGPQRAQVEIHCWTTAAQPITVGAFHDVLGSFARLHDPAVTALATQTDPSIYPNRIVEGLPPSPDAKPKATPKAMPTKAPAPVRKR